MNSQDNTTKADDWRLVPVQVRMMPTHAGQLEKELEAMRPNSCSRFILERLLEKYYAAEQADMAAAMGWDER
jgi:hypothetical protein